MNEANPAGHFCVELRGRPLVPGFSATEDSSFLLHIWPNPARKACFRPRRPPWRASMRYVCARNSLVGRQSGPWSPSTIIFLANMGNPFMPSSTRARCTEVPFKFFVTTFPVSFAFDYVSHMSCSTCKHAFGQNPCRKGMLHCWKMRSPS